MLDSNDQQIEDIIKKKRVETLLQDLLLSLVISGKNGSEKVAF